MDLTLDASALLAFLRDEPGAEAVAALLAAEENTCYVHALNLCEVFYDAYRNGGEEAAQRSIRRLADAGLVLRSDLDPGFWQEVGRFKALIRRISLADCHAMALARRLSAELVTADHHEFDSIAPLGLCAIRFIR